MKAGSFKKAAQDSSTRAMQMIAAHSGANTLKAEINEFMTVACSEHHNEVENEDV